MATIEFTTEELAAEEWRPVAGFEDRYEVSNLGRVKSLRYRHKRTAEILKPHLAKRRYLIVSLGRNRKRSVHSLVADAFLGPRPASTDGYEIEVNHEDGNKMNCRASNLGWLSQLENLKHARLNGLTRDVDGDHRKESKLSTPLVLSIRSRNAAGESLRAIARSLGVSHTIVILAAKGRTWSHVQ